MRLILLRRSWAVKAFWLVLVGLLVGLGLALGDENPFRKPTERAKADHLIETFKIDRMSYISQDLLEDLSLFFTNRQLAEIWDAANEAGGSVTSWDQLKGREGLGETTLWKLYVFFDLEGSIEEEE